MHSPYVGEQEQCPVGPMTTAPSSNSRTWTGASNQASLVRNYVRSGLVAIGMGSSHTSRAHPYANKVSLTAPVLPLQLRSPTVRMGSAGPEIGWEKPLACDTQKHPCIHASAPKIPGWRRRPMVGAGDTLLLHSPSRLTLLPMTLSWNTYPT